MPWLSKLLSAIFEATERGGLKVCVATHAGVFRGARAPLKTPAWGARVCGDAVLR